MPSFDILLACYRFVVAGTHHYTPAHRRARRVLAIAHRQDFCVCRIGHSTHLHVANPNHAPGHEDSWLVSAHHATNTQPSCSA